MIRAEESVDVSAPRLVEAEAVSATATETTILNAVGHANACDVWLRTPTAWEPLVVLRLYGRLNDVRVLLKTVRLSEAHRTTASGVIHALALSVRGRPVTAFELTVQSTGATVTGGILMLQVWSAPGAAAVTGGAPSATQQAGEERTVAHLALLADTTPVLAQGDATGRPIVVGAGASGAPAGGVFSVQGAGSGGVLANRAVRGGGAMFSFVSPSVSKPSVATAGATTWLMMLRSTTKRIEVQRIIVSYHGLAAANAADGRIIICRSPNAPTGSSTNVTCQPFDAADTASETALIPGTGGTALALTGGLDLISVAVRCDMRDSFVYDADAWGKPIVLRSSPQETLGIRFIVDTVASGQTFGLHATVIFIEI